MASFANELLKASELLERAASKLEAASGGGPPTLGAAMSARGGASGTGPFVGGLSAGRGLVAGMGAGGVALGAAGVAAGAVTGVAGAALDATNSAAAFLTPAARAYAVTGSSQAFASSVTSSVIGAVGGTAIGGFLLGAAGILPAVETNQRAGQAVLEVTESLRRIGVDVSPAQRQRMFDINQEREDRASNERELVGALVNSARELNDVRPRGANAEVFTAILGAITRVEGVLNLLVASLPAWLRS